MEHAIEFSRRVTCAWRRCTRIVENQALDRIVNFSRKIAEQQLLMDLSLNISARSSAQRLRPLKDGKGRVAAMEIMSAQHTAHHRSHLQRRRARDQADHGEDRTSSACRPSISVFFQLYDAGLIGYEDAMRDADSVNELRLMIKLNSQEAKQRDVLGRSIHIYGIL